MLQSLLLRTRRRDTILINLKKSFQNGLDKLRRQLERDEVQRVMNQLLKDARRLEPPLLSRLEHEVLKDTITTRLVGPLPHYYRGVSLLWIGHPEGAKRAFDDYLKQLPENGRASYATTLLRQANSLLSRNPGGY